jgi:hypothetical protein
VAALAAAAVVGGSGSARAEEVSPTGKGITGGALLGGEVVMLGEAIAGVKPTWAYVVGGVLGAGGGGYLGYLAEKNGDPKISFYMLAGGMAFAIPTTVAVLQSTSYKPEQDYTEDRPATGAPVADPPQPSAPPGAAPKAPSGSTSTLHLHWEQPFAVPMPTGVVAVQDGAVGMAVPAVEVRPMYSAAEMQKYGVGQQAEVRLPVFSATF